MSHKVYPTERVLRVVLLEFLGHNLSMYLIISPSLHCEKARPVQSGEDDPILCKPIQRSLETTCPNHGF